MGQLESSHFEENSKDLPKTEKPGIGGSVFLVLLGLGLFADRMAWCQKKQSG